MDNENSIRTLVAVSLIPRLNSCVCLPLLERCGGIEGLFHENEKAWKAICLESGLSPDAFDRKTAWRAADKELAEMDKYGILTCSIENSIYPELLKQCGDAPLVFFFKGRLQASPADKYLAIVGTRHASPHCQSHVETIVGDLSAMGHHPVVVSGLAFGIDASAHRASLKYGLTTYAVLGHGLHMIYPASHKGLAEAILEAGGALISEFPCCAKVFQANFLQRNRIVAGLCHATWVVESAEKGGAMATARLALGYDRDVMALPGRPEDKYSAGCNRLIKENIAALTENATDVARILNFPVAHAQPQQTSLNLFDTGENESVVLRILSEKGSMHIDELGQLSKIMSGELSALLLQLELEGKVVALPGKNYAGK